MKWVLLIAMILAVVVQLSAGRHAGPERRDHRCGPSVNCSLCDHKRCCSGSGYCGSGDDYCGIYSCAYDCPFDNTTNCIPTAIISVSADLSGLGRVNCAVCRVNMSMGWIQEHAPTVFCGRQPAGKSSGTSTTATEACGQCLKVTERETGAQTNVRLSEDECDRKGPMLGNAIFQELDSDGKGAAQGYLTVDYQSVLCEEG